MRFRFPSHYALRLTCGFDRYDSLLALSFSVPKACRWILRSSGFSLSNRVGLARGSFKTKDGFYSLRNLKWVGRNRSFERTSACNVTLDYSVGLKFRFCTICFKRPLGETRCVGSSFKAMCELNLAIRSSILGVGRHRYYPGFQPSITSGSMLILLVSLPPNGRTLARELL